MRYVNRDEVQAPRVFASEQAQRLRELSLVRFSEGLEKASQSRSELTADLDWLLADESLNSALNELFGGACAYCESKQVRLEVRPFRPPENAEPAKDRSTSHLYYSWMQAAWQNLYPVCLECMPKINTYFPVGRSGRAALPSNDELERYIERDDGRWPSYPLDEKPTLLDPCQDQDLWKHLDFAAAGYVEGRTKRGNLTIDIHELNRPELVAARRNVFNDSYAQLRQIIRGEEPRDLPWMSLKEGYVGAQQILFNTMLAQALGKRRSSPNLDRDLKRLGKKADGLQDLDRIWEVARDVDSQRSTSQAEHPTRPQSVGDIPQIARLSVKNFKSLEQIALDVPPFKEKKGQDYHVTSLLILGENATGKSTILEAIALAVLPRLIREKLGLDANTNILNPRFLGAPDRESRGLAQIKVEFSDQNHRTIKIRPDGFREEGIVPEVPVFAYGAFRQYLKSVKRYAPDKHVKTLFEGGEVLSNPEAWLKKLNKQDFNMVARSLRAAFNVEGSFEVLDRSSDGIFVISKLDDTLNGPLQRTPLSIVSSGFRAVLAMLCDIYQGLMDERVNPSFETLDTARGLVLVDEVEAHLHPRWKLSIMTGLRNALPYVNFIATSHDPLCLRGMGQNEVLVLQRIDGSQATTDLPVFTQTLTDLPDNEKWTIEQLLTADFFQLRSTESTEEERKMADMEDRLAKGIKPESDPELRRYLEELCEDLPIGHTDVHRLVQSAIAGYLREKRGANDARLSALRSDARKKIVDALKRSS